MDACKGTVVYLFFSFIFKEKKHAVLAFSRFKVSFIYGIHFFYSYLYDCLLFSYIQFSALCARSLRRCLKSSTAKEATKREESYIRISKWQNGKISDQVHPASKPISKFSLSPH